MWVNLIFLFYKPKASARETRMHFPNILKKQQLDCF